MIIPTITTPEITHTWASILSAAPASGEAVWLPARGGSAIPEKARCLIVFFKGLTGRPPAFRPRGHRRRDPSGRRQAPSKNLSWCWAAAAREPSLSRTQEAKCAPAHERPRPGRRRRTPARAGYRAAGVLPAVVGEGLVGLRHAVDVVLALVGA